MIVGSLLSEVCEAQTRNSTLTGDDLRRAGRRIAAIAASRDLAVLAVDPSGERLIGAALLADGRLRPVDHSSSFHGLSVLLVAGYVAAATGIAQEARRARALGAVSVEGVFYGGRPGPVAGCDVITEISGARPGLVAL